MAKVFLRDPSAALQTLFILQACFEHSHSACEGAGTGEQSPHPLEQAKNPWKNGVCGVLPSQAGIQVSGTGSTPWQESHWTHLSAIITLIVIQ